MVFFCFIQLVLKENLLQQIHGFESIFSLEVIFLLYLKLLNQLKKEGIEKCRIEGKESNEWKLVDAIDIIVHIFHPEKRKFYDLEKMWSELMPKERLII